MAGGQKTIDTKETRVGDAGYKRLFHRENSQAVEHIPKGAVPPPPWEVSRIPSLKQPGQTSQLTFRALKALIDLNGPDYPQLGHLPIPMVPGTHLSSAQGHRSFPGWCWFLVHLQPCLSLAIDTSDPDLDL